MIYFALFCLRVIVIITFFIHIPGVQYRIVHIQARSTMGKKGEKVTI